MNAKYMQSRMEKVYLMWTLSVSFSVWLGIVPT